MTNNNTRRGFTQNVVICPPCGEQSLAPEGFNPGVAVATKEGHNKEKAVWTLLPRLTAVLPPQGREMFRGFTLIELLVVVLIIGILAAIAVPQYQKAVIRVRLNELKPLVEAIHQAQELCYMTNGYYATSWDQLDVDPGGHNGTTYRRQYGNGKSCSIATGDYGASSCIHRNIGPNNLEITYSHYNDHSFMKGKVMCCSPNSMGQQVCATDTNNGKKENNCYYY